MQALHACVHSDYVRLFQLTKIKDTTEIMNKLLSIVAFSSSSSSSVFVRYQNRCCHFLMTHTHIQTIKYGSHYNNNIPHRWTLDFIGVPFLESVATTITTINLWYFCMSEYVNRVEFSHVENQYNWILRSLAFGFRFCHLLLVCFFSLISVFGCPICVALIDWFYLINTVQ